MSELVLMALSALVAIGIVYELGRDTDAEYRVRAARELGWQQAAQGFGPDDYPIDCSDAEREAWRRGWKEWHEGQP